MLSSGGFVVGLAIRVAFLIECFVVRDQATSGNARIGILLGTGRRVV
ncbi:hypothetical protein SAMN05880545_3255 [Microbacterium sp. RU33B]|nr:hypothetical protein SAMN05880545_3255 [Microbacterium sp. RU33B]